MEKTPKGFVHYNTHPSSQKPRLEHYRALLSYKNPNLDFIEEAFKEWSNYSEYLVFMKEHIYTGKKRFKAVKSSKRGNDVYSWRLKKRLEGFNEFPDVKFFDYKDRSKRQKTRALFVTLTFARIQRLDLAWEKVGEAYNRYMSRLRRRFGKIRGLRVWEAQKDGYPHIHAILIFEEQEFDTFFHSGQSNAWRIQRKRDLEWEYGFTDVEALSGIREGVRYVTKYLNKLHRVLGGSISSDKHTLSGGRRFDEKQGKMLDFSQEMLDSRASKPSGGLRGLVSSASIRTLSLMWIFKRRAFGYSKKLLDLITLMSNSNFQNKKKVVQVDFEGGSVWKWVLMGLWGGCLGDEWSRELSLKEYLGLKSSPSWSSF